MNELVEFLTSEEIIVVYIVAGIACLLCFIIYLIDKNYYKRKQRQNTRELNKLVEEVNKELDIDESEQVIYDEPVLETIETEQKLNQFENLIDEMNNEYVDKTEELELTEQLEIEEPVSKKVEEVVEKEESLENVILNNMSTTKDFDNISEEYLDEDQELTYTHTIPTKEEATKELQKLTEELKKQEQEIEEAQENISLTAYEEAQEENAIISLDELIKKSKQMYEENELTQYADEGNEPISLADLEMKLKEYKDEEPTTLETIIDEIESLDEPVITEIKEEQPMVIEQQKLVLDDFNTARIEEPAKPVYQNEKKFKRSPVISPIYGIKKDSPSDIELENTANYEKLDQEIKKTNDFLMNLKELQNNLD